MVIEGELALDARRPIPRAARRRARQSRRLPHRARRLHRHEQFRPLPAQRVPHPADRGAHALRLHQHGADRPLSRRRPARGQLLPRAAGRGGRAVDRHRPRSSCGGAISSRRGDALHDARSARPTTAAISPRLRRGARPRRLRRLCRAARALGGGGQAARHRHLLLPRASPAACPARARRCAFPAAAGCAGARHRRRPDRATRRSIAGSPPSASASRRARRRCAGRLRRASPSGGIGRLALDHDGRQRALAHASSGDREGQARRGACLEAAEADIDYRDGVFAVAGTDRRCRCSRSPRGRPSWRARARSPRASTPRPPPSAADLSRTAATSPRSRSIPRPASSRWSPTPRSTIAARCSTSAGRRPGARRRRAGRRPGAARSTRLRRRKRPAPRRLLHGLPHAARRPPAADRSAPSRAVPRPIRSASRASARRERRARSPRS